MREETKQNYSLIKFVRNTVAGSFLAVVSVYPLIGKLTSFNGDPGTERQHLYSI